jgi:MtaA/CmuA family methyltransferase
VLVRAQIETANALEFDYVSVISDPAREAADCGANISYFEDQPPAIDESDALLLEKAKLVGMKIPDPLGGGRMHDRVKGAAALKEQIGSEKLVEGWVEGPCAEGADLRGINNLMLDFYDDADFVRDLFSFILEMELGFAKAQIEAGCDLIGIGDAAASLVGPAIYEEFVWPVEKRLIDGIHQMGGRVRLHICGNATPLLVKMGQLGCEQVDLDFLASVSAARAAMGPDQVLAGNIDPVRVLRNGTPEAVLRAVEQCHKEAGDRFIITAGCEVPRDTPEVNLRAMLEYARLNS